MQKQPENPTEIWDKLAKTDPSATKNFTRAGGFRGTAIKPMWAFRRMTEEFGACGMGWGIGKPEFQVVHLQEGEVMVYCTVSIWHGDGLNVVWGVGGDKVVGKNRNGLSSDDEAFKKSFTDAITNALKLIGVGADVHMGLFDDNKYVAALKQEFSGTPPALPEPEGNRGQHPDAAAHVTKENGRYNGLSGPHKTKVELQQALRDIVHDLEGITDEQELDGFLKDNVMTIHQLQKDFPGWWDKERSDTNDFEGLKQRIDRIRERVKKEAA